MEILETTELLKHLGPFVIVVILIETKTSSQPGWPWTGDALY